ncbi:MAG: organic hydroperoxide resistance protein [Spirosomataceae bacterium]
MPKLYTASVRSVGGREGQLTSSDGVLDVKTEKPVQMGGKGGATNPEQLFAGAYAACYGGALLFVANKQSIELPADTSVDCNVSFNVGDTGGLFLSAELIVNLPGMEQEKAQRLAQTTHNVCPYSKAVKGNIEVELSVVV